MGVWVFEAGTNVAQGRDLIQETRTLHTVHGSLSVVDDEWSERGYLSI